MDESQIAKDTLKKEYLKEILKESSKKLDLNEDAIFLGNNGEILFSADVTELYTVVRFLASELANAKAELWLQSLKSEK